MAVAIELIDGEKFITGKLTISGVADLAEARRQIISLLKGQSVSGDAADGPWAIRDALGYIGAENEFLYMSLRDTMIMEAIKHGSAEFVC